MKPVLHLLTGPPDGLVAQVLEEQRRAGIPLVVIRLDEVTYWGQVVDRVLEAEAVATW